MKQILIFCATFVILLLAVVGCMYIFDVLSFDASKTAVLKIGGAIVLLGVCSALITLLMRVNKGQ